LGGHQGRLGVVGGTSSVRRENAAAPVGQVLCELYAALVTSPNSVLGCS
jgi:hypothetical protein